MGFFGFERFIFNYKHDKKTFCHIHPSHHHPIPDHLIHMYDTLTFKFKCQGSGGGGRGAFLSHTPPPPPPPHP